MKQDAIPKGALRQNAIKELVFFLKSGSLHNAYEIMISFGITKKEIMEENRRTGGHLAKEALEEFYLYCSRQAQKKFEKHLKE
ncbi:MAG: hypothetical protein N3G80_00225 [Candidatus Micrarchaeota archaeon]|nr:hypothetical protein [Candidatus Micrarchaeota archaeon]